jgi:hypothetical protein
MTTTRWLALAATLVAGTSWAFDRPAPPTEEERAALFAEADADASGGLSRDEFETLFELIRKRHADRRFAAADTDQNGELTQDELEAARPQRDGRRGRGPQPPM